MTSDFPEQRGPQTTTFSFNLTLKNDTRQFTFDVSSAGAVSDE